MSCATASANSDKWKPMGNHVQHSCKVGSENLWQHAEMDLSPLCRPNPFTDQNQNSQKSLRSLVHQTRQDSACPITTVPPADGQHILLLVFYFGRFLESHTTKTARAIFIIYTSNDAVWRKEVPFWGPIDTSSPLGEEIPPKLPKLGLIKGISSLNKTVNNFDIVEGILAQ